MGGANKGDETLRLTSMRLSELHFAISDFLSIGAPHLKRSDHFRIALENYALEQPNWDLDRFLRYAREQVAPTLKKASVRNAFLESVEIFKKRVESETELMVDETVDSFKSSSADFEL